MTDSDASDQVSSGQASHRLLPRVLSARCEGFVPGALNGCMASTYKCCCTATELWNTSPTHSTASTVTRATSALGHQFHLPRGNASAKKLTTAAPRVTDGDRTKGYPNLLRSVLFPHCLLTLRCAGRAATNRLESRWAMGPILSPS